MALYSVYLGLLLFGHAGARHRGPAPAYASPTSITTGKRPESRRNPSNYRRRRVCVGSTPVELASLRRL